MSSFVAQPSNNQSPVSVGYTVEFSYQTGLLTTWTPTVDQANRLGSGYKMTQLQVNASDVNGMITAFFDDFGAVQGYYTKLQNLVTPNTWWTININTDDGSAEIKNVLVQSAMPRTRRGSYRYLSTSYNYIVETDLVLTYNKETPFNP